MSIKIRSFFFVMLLASSLCSFAQLPDWAQAALTSVQGTTPPEDEAVWRLLDQTRITLRSDGKWHKQRRLVSLVLQQRGGDSAAVYLIDGQEDNTKIRKLKGWHLNTNGKLKKLDKDNVGTLGMSSRSVSSIDTVTAAFFERVNKGDLVAFESEEEESSYMAVSSATLLGANPIHTRVIELINEGTGGEVILKPLGMEAWGISPQQQGNRLTFRDLPALRNEIFTPDSYLEYPSVLYGFFTKGDKEPLASWDNMARWYAGLFREKSGSSTQGSAAQSLESLQEAANLFRTKISYRQVYLSSARGYEPIKGEEVVRRGYGDCKDMVSCLSWQLGKSGVTVHPALTNIISGPYTTAETPTHAAFNHVIGAIPLSKSLGLPAEVEVDGSRYLMFDPTDRYTNLGYLGSHFQGRSAMICTDEGARWVAIPDAALDNASIEASLQGQVDANFTLQGSLTLVEHGDAWGLRSTYNQGNLPDLLYSLRLQLQVPGVVDLVATAPVLGGDGTLTLNLQVNWPGFMARDAGGLCLPRGITGSYYRSLAGDKPRQQPIWIDSNLPISWKMELALPVALSASNNSCIIDDKLGKLTWEATVGQMLTINFTSSRVMTSFGLDKLEEGEAAWESYRNSFNQFILGSTQFYQNAAN